MKKYFYIILASFLLGSFSLAAMAASAPSVNEVNITADKVPGIIMNIATWLYRIILAAAVVFVLIAASQYLTGNPKSVEKAHKQLLYAVVAIVVAIVAFSIVKIVQGIIQ